MQVGEPDFYGRIDIGNFPQPRVIYRQPVVIQALPMGQMVREPIYLYVPPGHAKHWRKHCREYNACGRSTSCRIAGTTRNTCRAIGRATAAVTASVMVMTMASGTSMATAMATARATARATRMTEPNHLASETT